MVHVFSQWCASFSCFLSPLLFFSFLFPFLLFQSINPVHAAAGITVDEMPLGTVVVINGIKLVKITTTNKFMAIEPFTDCNPATDMQCFDQCGNWVTPATGTMNYSNANGLNASSKTELRDLRDGKTYEVRKFADGKCWMVNDLRYGGTADACLSRTAFGGNGSATLTNRFGTGTYGDCRNDPGYATYLYNWQAAMQNSTAYYNATYSGPMQNVQGLCPNGWHVPTGGPTGEQAALDKAIGGTGANGQSSGNSFTFWRPGGNFLAIYTGYCGASGALDGQGGYTHYWSSSQLSAADAYAVFINNSYIYPQYSISKFYGFALRCVKN